MADGVCVPGTVINKNNRLVKETVDLLSISRKDCLHDNILNDMNASFFISGKRSNLCRCFGSSGVVSLDVHASDVLCGDKTSEHVEFAQICHETEDNCRKKRCTDRYDSSESSDSGVAALGSSGTSDITDPGSPFSTASTSSNSESGDEKCYPSTPTSPQWSPPHKRCSNSARIETPKKTCRSNIPVTKPALKNAKQSLETRSSDGRSFLSLGNAERLAKVSKPSIPSIQTRNPVWNITLEADQLETETFTATQIGLAKDNEVGKAKLSTSSFNETPKSGKTCLGKTRRSSTSSKCTQSLSGNQEHKETNLANIKTRSTSWNLSKVDSSISSSDEAVPPLTSIARKVAKYCTLARKTNNIQWPGSKSPVYETTQESTDCFNSSVKTSRWGPAVHSAPSYHVKGNGVTQPRSRILVSTSSSTELRNSVVTDPVTRCESPTQTKYKSSMAPNVVSADTNCESLENLNEKGPKRVSRLSLATVCMTRQQTQKGGDKNHNTRKCVALQETKHDQDLQQGKITKYFKTQMKPLNAVKRELAKEFQCPNITKKMSLANIQNGDSDSIDNYLSLISSPPCKIAKKDHVVANKSISITSPVQIFLVNKLEADSRMPKTLPHHKNGLVMSPRKIKTQSLKVSERKKGTHVFTTPSSKPAVFLKPSNQKLLKKASSKLKLQTIQNTSVTINRSEGVPIVSLTNGELSSITSTSFKTVISSADILSKSSKSNFKCKTVLDQELGIASCSSDSSSVLSSLSVSIANATTSCQLSPILSAPKTIRFPAAQRMSLHSKDQDRDEKCLWADCKAMFESSTGLMEHLQVEHVANQVRNEHYVCLWVGCKVYARTSCSRSWLERHVLSHGGNKPFRCIVEGCGQRFGTNTALERHVNSHFDQEESGSSNQGQRRSIEGASGKLMRRNGKKLRYRKQPWSARMFDYFDTGIMEHLQYKLLTLNQDRNQGETSTDTPELVGETVRLVSTIKAKRVTPDGRTEWLLTWRPKNLVEDEWVSEIVESKVIPVNQLSFDAKVELYPTLFRTRSRRRKAETRPRDLPWLMMKRKQ